MKPPVDNLRLNVKAREKLIRLKRHTGINHWNTLCRWAFCLSLNDRRLPPEIDREKTVAVEMSWRIFAGDLDITLSALFATWKQQTPLASEIDNGELVRRHVQRGLGILESQRISKIEELLQLSDIISTTRS